MFAQPQCQELWPHSIAEGMGHGGGTSLLWKAGGLRARLHLSFRNMCVCTCAHVHTHTHTQPHMIKIKINSDITCSDMSKTELQRPCDTQTQRQTREGLIDIPHSRTLSYEDMTHKHAIWHKTDTHAHPYRYSLQHTHRAVTHRLRPCPHFPDNCARK